MKYNIFFFIAVLSTQTFAYAQADGSSSYEQINEYGEENTSSSHESINPAEVSQKKGYDTEHIEVRKFDRKKWESVVGDKDYAEEESKKKRNRQDTQSSEGSTKRIERSEDDDEPESNFSSMSPMTGLIVKIIFYGLAIAIIGYVLFLIIKNTSLRSNKKVTKNDLPDHATPVEDIKELEIDRLLREAMASGNYPLVIRIYFLGLLQRLDEDGFITWKKDKTNRDYLYELFSKAHYYEEVKGLTLAYEQVWYGDHNLPIQTYEQIIAVFKGVDQKLKASKAQ